MSIYYDLKRKDALKAKDLQELEDKGYQAISSDLNEMKRRNVVTELGRDGRAKVWGLVRDLREDEPMRVVETETVVEEKEVPPDEDLRDVLGRNRDLIYLTIGGTVLGVILLLYGALVSPIGSVPWVLTLVSLTGLGTVLSMALNEVRTDGE